MRTHLLVSRPEFRRFFIARLISNIGWKLYSIALTWHVLDLDPERGKSALPLLMAVSFLPIVLAGPFMCAWIDRWDKRHCMIVADSVWCGLIATLKILLRS